MTFLKQLWRNQSMSRLPASTTVHSTSRYWSDPPFPAQQLPLLCSTTNHWQPSGTHRTTCLQSNRKGQPGSLWDQLSSSVLALTASSPPTPSQAWNSTPSRNQPTASYTHHSSPHLISPFASVSERKFGVCRNTCINVRRGGGEIDWSLQQSALVTVSMTLRWSTPAGSQHHLSLGPRICPLSSVTAQGGTHFFPTSPEPHTECCMSELVICMARAWVHFTVPKTKSQSQPWGSTPTSFLLTLAVFHFIPTDTEHIYIFMSYDVMFWLLYILRSDQPGAIIISTTLQLNHFFVIKAIRILPSVLRPVLHY